jgi:anti-sigma regulatory factor (Ser/Thr protein kinase)
MLPPSRAIPISATDPSQTGNARRLAASMAAALNFDETRQGQISIVVTEAARNIAAHAVSGELVLCPWKVSDDVGIDIFALDRGKGIPDVMQALEDGYSTAGTAGEGLGAISRLASEFHIYSATGQGTALFARMHRKGGETTAPAHFAWGAVSAPIAGESANGDGWYVHHTAERSVYLMADGLGHGPLAAEAAEEAIRMFQLSAERPLEQIMQAIHGSLAKTRGAAVSLAEVRAGHRVVNYVGIGNISASIWSRGKTRSMVSMNGTVGHTIARIQSFSYPWESASMLLMHSDGIGTRWALDQYPGLAQKHPALIAAVLYRDFSRRRDDATVIVSRL